jgi:peptidoglycan hydrolase-like protein with peptidoglycan-binding domain
MQPRKFRMLSAITAGSLAVAVVAITATTSGTSQKMLAAQTQSFSGVNLDECPILHTGYPTGGCVAQLQTDLKISQDNNLVVDGIFGSQGSQTYNAVIAFQGAHGLKQDGMVGPATKRALEAAVSVPTPVPEPLPPTQAPAPPAPVSPPAPIQHDYPASFNPQAAAAWAVSNAMAPLPVPVNWKQIFTGDKEPCTTFVSWALAKGGMPEEADWFPYWDSPSNQHSVFLYMSSNEPVPAWYAANDFVSRFTGLGWATESQIYPGSTPTAISVGDVIYYQWDGTPNHPHLAMVTSIVNGQIKVTDQGGPTLYPGSTDRPMLRDHAGGDLTIPTPSHPHLKVFVIHWQ